MSRFYQDSGAWEFSRLLQLVPSKRNQAFLKFSFGKMRFLCLVYGFCGPRGSAHVLNSNQKVKGSEFWA